MTSRGSQVGSAAGLNAVETSATYRCMTAAPLSSPVSWTGATMLLCSELVSTFCTRAASAAPRSIAI